MWLAHLNVLTRSCPVLSHRTRHTERANSDRVVCPLISIDITPFLVPFSPTQPPVPAQTITAVSGDNDEGNDTRQYVHNTYDHFNRGRSRPCVHPSPKPSTTPVGEQHNPMATVHKRSRGVCTIHVYLPQSSLSNQYANPLLIPIAFHSTMQIKPLEPPRSP